MDIFKEYTEAVESFIEAELEKRMPAVTMKDFLQGKSAVETRELLTIQYYSLFIRKTRMLQDANLTFT